MRDCFAGGITRLIRNVNRIEVAIDLEGVEEKAYWHVGEILAELLANPKTKNREAIQTAFRLALAECPDANASDL